MSNKCPRCEKSVYPMEAISFDGIMYHKACFKCPVENQGKLCNAQLSATNVGIIAKKVMCKHCYKRIFKEKGSYASFGADTLPTQTKVSTKDLIAAGVISGKAGEAVPDSYANPTTPKPSSPTPAPVQEKKVEVAPAKVEATPAKIEVAPVKVEEKVVTPVVEEKVEEVVAPVVEEKVEEVVVPEVEEKVEEVAVTVPVVEEKVEEVVAPVVEEKVEEVVPEVEEVVEEVAAPVEEVTVVEEKVEEVAGPVEEVVAPVEEVAAPVEEVAAPVEEKVEEVAAPVEEKVEEVAPVVEEKVEEAVTPVVETPSTPTAQITTTEVGTMSADLPVRNFTMRGTILNVVQNKCKVCTKTVYDIEKVSYDSEIYHKSCFKCPNTINGVVCNAQLTASNVGKISGKIFCKSCYKKIFTEKGSYSSFGADTIAKTGASTLDKINAGLIQQ